MQREVCVRQEWLNVITVANRDILRGNAGIKVRGLLRMGHVQTAITAMMDGIETKVRKFR